jgi:hypothetical protein
MDTSLADDLALKYPIVGIAGCCAYVRRTETRGMLPRRPINSRRLIPRPRPRIKRLPKAKYCIGRRLKPAYAGWRMSEMGSKSDLKDLLGSTSNSGIQLIGCEVRYVPKCS